MDNTGEETNCNHVLMTRNAHRHVILSWSVMLLSYIDCVTTEVWNKSPSLRLNDHRDIIFIEKLRSKIECSIQCTKTTGCNSFQYNQNTRTCTALSLYSQTGMVVQSLDTSHYSVQKVCESGYYTLPTTRACVKSFHDYLMWNDSLRACLRFGADLPVLNTDILYTEFLDYMDNVVTQGSRVVVKGYLVNNIPYWSTGESVDLSKFCKYTPDLLNTPAVCLYLAHKSESWCGSIINRLDDAPCNDRQPRICMKP